MWGSTSEITGDNQCNLNSWSGGGNREKNQTWPASKYTIEVAGPLHNVLVQDKLNWWLIKHSLQNIHSFKPRKQKTQG